MDYLIDLSLDSNDDVHLDGANDLALVSGRRNLEQSVRIGAGDAIEEFIGSSFTGTDVAILEEALRDTLSADPQIDSVVSLDVVEYDRRTDSISIQIQLDDNDDFTISV